MAFATAICWGFNFVLALTFPPMAEVFGKGGAFFFYACCNLLGWLYAYFFMFETRQAPLEALDQRFGVRFRDFARYNYYRLPWMKSKPLPTELEEVKDVMTRKWDTAEVCKSLEAGQETGSVNKVMGCFRRPQEHASTSTGKAQEDIVHGAASDTTQGHARNTSGLSDANTLLQLNAESVVPRDEPASASDSIPHAR